MDDGQMGGGDAPAAPAPQGDGAAMPGATPDTAAPQAPQQ